jgi:hypothetical protein
MRRRSWSRVAGALIAGLGLAALPGGIATSAHAAEACTTRTVSQPFTQWSDSNDYFPMTSGTFESGTSGWTLGSGVSRVAENEPWKVAAGGAYSLKIPGGASVSTPEMCVASTEDSARFFYKSPGAFATLQVSIKAKNSVSNNLYITGFTIQAGTVPGWQVSPRIALPDVRGTQGVEDLTITLTPSSGTGAWQIDDVFVDPSRTR